MVRYRWDIVCEIETPRMRGKETGGNEIWNMVRRDPE